MSSDTKLTKKQKKGLAFRERRGKGKARAADFEDNALPAMDNPDQAEAELGADVAKAGAEAGVVEVQSRDAEAEPRGAKVVGESKKESKKRKRHPDEGEDGEQKTIPKKRKGKGKAMEQEGGDAEAVEDGETVNSAEKGKGKGKEKQQRFILFVGNLKYTTTKEAVQAHFSACDPPPTVRLMTPKPSATGRPTAKSKGFAFLEFTNKQPLQTALKLHQSDLQGRMINVELTAGGGGKSDGRLKKVKERNKELFEQRKKKLEQQKGKNDTESDVKDLARPQRYSSTSGFTQTTAPKRTWSIPEGGEDQPKKKKRGIKKPAKSQGTGVNAIPVG